MFDSSDGEGCFLPPAVQASLEALLAFLAEPVEELPPSLSQSREVARSWLDAVTHRKQVVELGAVCATPGALRAIGRADIILALARHQSGDWGLLDVDDWQENDRSLRTGYRLLSAFQSTAGTRFWIITEADRSTTTVLLPDEY